MKTAQGLPLPSLSRGRFLRSDASASEEAIYAYTDEALFEASGVRIAFTERAGGFSVSPFDSLNLGEYVDDDPAVVQGNRRKLLSALGFPNAQIISPKQVHGTDVAIWRYMNETNLVRQTAQQGADALVVEDAQCAALLVFADCMPVILVAPNGAFAVAHAGWRGAYGHVAVRALLALCEYSCCQPGECNAYIGPYIHAECFEVSNDLMQRFSIAFGEDCTPDARHVDLGRVVSSDLQHAGIVPERIADVDICTACNTSKFYSYRAQQGICGRHGALAVRQ